MVIEEISSAAPTETLQNAWDWVWIQWAEGSKPGPFQNPVVQALDWSLQGVLSRSVKEGRVSQAPVFFPTMGKVPARMVVLSPKMVDNWDQFFANSQGMNAKRILVCDGAGKFVEKLQKEASQTKRECGVEEVSWIAGI